MTIGVARREGLFNIPMTEKWEQRTVFGCPLIRTEESERLCPARKAIRETSRRRFGVSDETVAGGFQ